MITKRNSDVNIKVKMFGEFSIVINGNGIENLKGNTKRVWMLIQYLIANRFKMISLEQLIEDLWDGKPCRDPGNALKNLVYRAREILKDLSGKDKIQFILFLNGTYSWNNQYECDVDSERFLKYCNDGNNAANSAEKRISAYKKVIAIYRGGFLPRSAYSSWIITLSSYFSQKYIECIENICHILIGQKQFQEVISICKTALQNLPLEESFHKILLSAYVGAGRRNEAFKHYNEAINLFYKEYGINISENLHPYYKQLVNNGQTVETNFDLIKKDLQEEQGVSGAYFCDYDVFKSIYRAQARIISRTGQSIFIVLFTISRINKSLPNSNTNKAAFEKLKSAIIETLRKSDIIASCSMSQFIVMLPMTSYEDTQIAINRIIKKFRFEYRKSKVEISTKISPLE